MRALKRGDEIRPETCWTQFEKNHLAWLTGTEVDEEGNPIGKGDGWTLIEDYIPPTEEAEE